MWRRKRPLVPRFKAQSLCVPSPAEEYQSRLERRRAAHERLNRIDARFALARLAIFAGAALMLVAAIRGLTSYWPLTIPAVVFAVLIRRHDRSVRTRDESARAIDFYDRRIARIEDRWIGTGATGDRFRDERHLSANDLDLFGVGSLFELLSTARTRAGEETLATWLKTGAPPEEIAARHDALRELAGLLDLRESLAVVGVRATGEMRGESLVEWGEAPPSAVPSALRWLAIAVTVATVAAIALWLNTGDARLMAAGLVVEGAFLLRQHRRLDRIIHGAEAALEDLDVLSHLLELLERERFSAARLEGIRDRLATDGASASRSIRRLHRLIEMHDWYHNEIFRILSIPLMWRLHVGWTIEAWRVVHGPSIRKWMGAVAEFEALASLAAYHYEHPEDPFPVIVTSGDKRPPTARFEGSALGHPLLPASRMVCNDVHLDDNTRLLVVSGSNMSGKSTLLRTVGINAVLALAGSPVRAASLRLTPLIPGATLRIQDSLQEGRSRFFAEITRIRELADAASGPVPLLFLLDELFHGTNSHDRLVGASGVLRSFLDRGAIGLVTTHDLALTAIADDLAPRAANIHFEDTFEGGEIRFDYRARPGRVTRSNALALMRAVGLDVGGPGSS